MNSIKNSAIKKDLLRIANTLVLYSYHITNHGLYKGKMGIILYLYCYSKLTGNEIYRDFAGEMLDVVLRDANSLQNDFENGLTGIGWAINYLLKNNLLEGDVNEVLQNVDKRVFSEVRCNPEISIFGQGLYLLLRIEDNKDLESEIPCALDFCYKSLKNFKGTISLYHLNSILYFLLEIDKKMKYTDKTTNIRTLIPPILEKIKLKKFYDYSDKIVLDQILSNIENTEKDKWTEIQESRPQTVPPNDNMIGQNIRIAWLQKLYFSNKNVGHIFFNEIERFINQKQESIAIDDFLFEKGLAGFGFAILSQVL